MEFPLKLCCVLLGWSAFPSEESVKGGPHQSRTEELERKIIFQMCPSVPLGKMFLLCGSQAPPCKKHCWVLRVLLQLWNIMGWPSLSCQFTPNFVLTLAWTWSPASSLRYFCIYSLGHLGCTSDSLREISKSMEVKPQRFCLNCLGVGLWPSF